jgi:hypothetical protein
VCVCERESLREEKEKEKEEKEKMKRRGSSGTSTGRISSNDMARLKRNRIPRLHK